MNMAVLEAADWRRMPSQRLRLPVAVPRRLVAAGDRVYVTLGYQAPLTALDAATGALHDTLQAAGEPAAADPDAIEALREPLATALRAWVPS